MLNRRRCGVLLHPSSLPGEGGIGSLGENARRFVDLLSDMGMSYWQILPLAPPACGNSPYSAFSAFAGNPLLIDLEELVHEGDLPDALSVNCGIEAKVDFGSVTKMKLEALHIAAASFFSAAKRERMEEFWHFCDTTGWLHDYALFMALKHKYKGKMWQRWPRDAALLMPGIYEKASKELGQEIGVQKYQQWQFFRQWRSLHAYASERGIGIIGDLPIFVGYDSADVWRNRKIFLLDETGKPTEVAGVPPDYFCKTGQLWGNPLYDWDELKRQSYLWWIERFRQMYNMYDCVRIDHFRGFEAAWQVPAVETTAVNGHWGKGPGSHFFGILHATLGQLPIIAEDLGVITDEVVALREQCGYPGMKILQFAFGSGADNPYLPHNHQKNSVVYTGTHDNDTTIGWYDKLTPELKKSVADYLGTVECSAVSGMIRAALMSVADTAIIPLQDLLALPTEARLNIPGTADGNWSWRFTWSMIGNDLVKSTAALLELYGRRRGNYF
jgi:4-alpha-glucanotransferase